MLPELFLKKAFIIKNVEQPQKEKSSVKNVIINDISSEHSANLYYARAILTLVLVLHCC